jgi:hypothetical protein
MNGQEVQSELAGIKSHQRNNETLILKKFEEISSKVSEASEKDDLVRF